MSLNFQLGAKIVSLFAHTRDRDDIIGALEELLIAADFGIDFTHAIMNELAAQNLSTDQNEWIVQLKQILKEKMSHEILHQNIGSQTVWLVFGVNGTGKTTTVGKLAYRLKKEGKTVLIAAADTYRDAAIDQLLIWARRADVPVVRQMQGADPAAVVYDACDAALKRKVNALLIDTAGRLHNKEQLMEELGKISRVIAKKFPTAQIRKVLTVDATTGQNALNQTALFSHYTGVDGIILTKLDSSAKGGIACAISWKYKIPVLYVGTGEKVEDLEVFTIDQYLQGLFLS